MVLSFSHISSAPGLPAANCLDLPHSCHSHSPGSGPGPILLLVLDLVWVLVLVLVLILVPDMVLILGPYSETKGEERKDFDKRFKKFMRFLFLCLFISSLG